MRKTLYYSVRTGRHPTGGGFELGDLKRLFHVLYSNFEAQGMFQQFLGYVCVDAGQINGNSRQRRGGVLLQEVAKALTLADRRGNLQLLLRTTYSTSSNSSTTALAKGLMVDCTRTPTAAGTTRRSMTMRVRKRIGLRLMKSFVGTKGALSSTADGDIIGIAPNGLADLEIAPAPPGHPDAVQARVAAAVSKFRRRNSTGDDRRDAVRDLADVLEADLFEIANNFGIRHHNQKQKCDYDHTIWQDWMFYYYLATVYASTRLIAKGSQAGDGRCSST